MIFDAALRCLCMMIDAGLVTDDDGWAMIVMMHDADVSWNSNADDG